jgi:para-nitrobenzyl esterase
MLMLRRIVLGVVLALGLVGPVLAQSPTADLTLVALASGAVRGVSEGEVIGFRGIPYAQPPVGELRWRAPQPVAPWAGVLEADAFGPSCMQAAVDAPGPVSEDCLTINVWRPATVSTTALPVMVWIHGGSMVRGGAVLYPGNALAAQGVVVVSLNYRLGRLGFFAHPALATEAPDDLRGNYGYMDQREALAWVQRNIAAFGGDPDNVTIFGESAGGGSVLVHLTSPLSQGLFQRAILQSPGTPGARADVIPSATLIDAEQIAVDYARGVGIADDDPEGLAELRALPAETLVEGASGDEVQAALAAGTRAPGMAMSILDGTLLVKPAEDLLAAGEQAMVPVIVGANNRDLGLGTAASKDELFALFGAHAAEARALYDPTGGEALEELKQQVYADQYMTEPARHLADEMARAGQPVWHYRFSYVAETSRDEQPGVLHGFELPYTLDMPGALVGEGAVTAEDRGMAELVSAYWVSFAKTGDPNGDDRPDWPRHDPESDLLMNFTDDGAVVEPDPIGARLDLWELGRTERR